MSTKKKIKFFSKHKESFPALIYECFSLLVIIISILPLFFHYQHIGGTWQYDNNVIEWIYSHDIIFLSLFVFDFFLRWIVFSINGFYINKKKGYTSILLFPISLNGIIGILTILPLFFPLPIVRGFRFLKIFLLTDLILRLKRVRFIGEIINGFSFLMFSIKLQGKMILTLTIILITTVLTLSVIIYNVSLIDPTAFGESEQHIDNFFDAFWFTFVTITTIGYGDIYPVDIVGRLLVVVISITGIIFVAIYTSLIINGLRLGFQKKLELDKNNKIIREENKKLAKIISQKRRHFIKGIFQNKSSTEKKEEKLIMETIEHQSEERLEKAQLKIEEISKIETIEDEEDDIEVKNDSDVKDKNDNKSKDKNIKK